MILEGLSLIGPFMQLFGQCNRVQGLVVEHELPLTTTSDQVDISEDIEVGYSK
ncbi:hypothetical protein BABINDRAFT_159064 [Babjeviella inositovora NRRL Y-12698]|uniref:Uncharacterized protein n=1 Tax=Babjeviella inositovora NRRL Y-12698 TaxID=984486 RepID=A0A1E3QY25_9ASCO|nr:uncharacterized protein BABINDRAFT_159064 [Babjeviella inositovora NRRL Y-12698]ODQ82484.1 hypothetical protein BABINDRAFT_159064 [Babjeviella inositovora NRRL Y-12698]